MNHPENCPLCNQEEEILIIYWFLVCSQGSFGSASFSMYTFRNSPYRWTPFHFQNGDEDERIMRMSEYWDPERRALTLW
jgi:hypothetical protein